MEMCSIEHVLCGAVLKSAGLHSPSNPNQPRADTTEGETAWKSQFLIFLSFVCEKNKLVI